jgi:hypothetical protein
MSSHDDVHKLMIRNLYYLDKEENTTKNALKISEILNHCVDLNRYRMTFSDSVEDTSKEVFKSIRQKNPLKTSMILDECIEINKKNIEILLMNKFEAEFVFKHFYDQNKNNTWSVKGNKHYFFSNQKFLTNIKITAQVEIALQVLRITYVVHDNFPIVINETEL